MHLQEIIENMTISIFNFMKKNFEKKIEKEEKRKAVFSINSRKWGEYDATHK